MHFSQFLALEMRINPRQIFFFNFLEKDCFQIFRDRSFIFAIFKEIIYFKNVNEFKMLDSAPDQL